MNFGNWDKTKYIIISPFDKAELSSFVGGNTVDFYMQGSFKIPQGSYILCPQEEMALVKEMNPSLKTIGYMGEYSKGYGDLLIQLLGFKKEEIGKWNWENEADESKVANLIKELGFKFGGHTDSIEDKRDWALTEMNAICEILNTVNEKRINS